VIRGLASAATTPPHSAQTQRAGPFVGLRTGLTYSASPLLVLSSVSKAEQGLASVTQSMTVNLA
jgi:hypothetical protein